MFLVQKHYFQPSVGGKKWKLCSAEVSSETEVNQRQTCRRLYLLSLMYICQHFTHVYVNSQVPQTAMSILTQQQTARIFTTRGVGIYWQFLSSLYNSRFAWNRTAERWKVFTQIINILLSSFDVFRSHLMRLLWLWVWWSCWDWGELIGNSRWS